MKTYDDLAGDGGSNVIEQVVSQSEKNCANDLTYDQAQSFRDER